MTSSCRPRTRAVQKVKDLDIALRVADNELFERLVKADCGDLLVDNVAVDAQQSAGAARPDLGRRARRGQKGTLARETIETSRRERERKRKNIIQRKREWERDEKRESRDMRQTGKREKTTIWSQERNQNTIWYVSA